jgi:hypothetical protein
MNLAKAMADEFARLAERFPRFASYGFGVGAGEDKHAFPCDIESLADAQVAAIFYYGRRAYNDDWNGSTEKEEGKSQADFYATWIKEFGITKGMSGKGGGGGARRDANVTGWITWLGLMKHKENGAAVNGKTLHRAQETLCRRDLLKAHPELIGKGDTMEAKRIAAVTADLSRWVAEKEKDPMLAGMIGMAAGAAATKES